MSIVTIEQLKSKFEGGDHPGSADYINLIDTLAALPEGGNVVLNGVGVPSSGTGANGDFYINTSNYDIYGPKTSGSWGSATSLVGPTGATGSTGSQGATGATGAAGTNGTNGATGDTGPAGPGVSSGGTTGQYLTKVDGTNYNTQWSTLDLSGKQDVVANVSSTEIGYLDGVTSAIQTQLNAKQAVVSGVDDTEIGYLNGVTSAIQTQLDAKTAKSTLSTTGDIYYASSANTPARLGIGSAGNVLTVASGIPSWAAPSSGTPAFVGASLYKGSYQNLSNGVWTAITWSNEFFDTDAYHDTSSNTSRITIPAGKAGKYLIAGMLDWSSGTSSREIALYKNGETHRFLSKVILSASSTWQQNFVTVINLAVSDYVEIYGNVSGVGFSVDGGTDRTQVAITYLGA